MAAPAGLAASVLEASARVTLCVLVLLGTWLPSVLSPPTELVDSLKLNWFHSSLTIDLGLRFEKHY